MTTRSKQKDRKKSKQNLLDSTDMTEEPNSAPLPIDATINTSLRNTDAALDGECEPEVTGEMRESVKQVLSDTNLLHPLVSSVVSVVLLTPEIFNPLVDAVSKALTKKITEMLKPEIKQSVYESVSMDIEDTKKEMATLRQELNQVRKEKTQLENRVEEAEQYSRRNCLLLHGVPEKPKEDTTAVAVEIIRDKLDLDFEYYDFDRTHRLGKPNKTDQNTSAKPRPRPIIMKFISYADRAQVYQTKRELKHSGMLITENLTATRMNLYRVAQQMVKDERISSTWTQDGRITVLTHMNRKVTVNSLAELDKL
ncbi:uncharacterized protein [Amphiura filiformis]|uniref:uncharacterized protein n=1 Tax=Amphiura filiformis TaxID=82378 RepID=UPI003B21BE2B